ncbi:DUF1800 family protein [uncultured Cocleimonas sp.]|uniref:DUF1800 domain-containing protein n=1 Tax=uncultured Cocleimonas sp. TaxID=1051587 RepID=UPI00260D1738|nr:DUF1800 domain-containing protein [uncultured Cocleimonas sp.]
MSINCKIVTLFVTTVVLSACGGGGGSGTTSNTPDIITTTPPSTDSTTTATSSIQVKNQRDASKFLARSTYGPTKESINQLLAKETYDAWLNQQFLTAPTYHFPYVKQLAKQMCADKDDDGKLLVDTWEAVYARHQVWWETATGAEDQLRQRVALALSEILVISDSPGLGLSNFQYAVTSYYDVLVKHAFGNYRNLLTDVTLHPAMGDFLSMSRNQKANTEGTIRPDENYARELLQLFTIGVHELNLDGSEKLDANGATIPTYDQKTIEEFAKVFTGWNYSNLEWYEYLGHGDHTVPLVAVEKYHDISAKTLLNGAQSSANQTARQDLDFALDNIFQHQNIAPFISKQLIKRLVTSNPSPQYVERVAEKFNDNGEGIKGDLKAVVSAILLDDEALATNKPDSFGKLREPMLRMSHLWRVFDMQTSLKVGHYWESDKRCGEGNYRNYNFYSSLDWFAQITGQGPLQARSVFNFYKPSYSPSGILSENGLSAPEFQIINENTMVAGSNLYHQIIEEFSDSKPITPELEGYSKLNLSDVTDLAVDTEKLLDYLSLVLLDNNMSSSLRDILTDHLNAPDIYQEGREGQLQKAREAILLIISTPEYLIQK